MSLSWCSDVSPADWLTNGDIDPWRLITLGPAGFAAYARLRFIPDPTYPAQREADADIDDGPPESEVARMRCLLDVLTRHTETPNDCYFCLWDGWASNIYGGDMLRMADWATRTVTRGPALAPAFDQHILNGPKVDIPPRVEIPHRKYFLFRGRLADFGDWGAADYLPGMPRTDMPNPSFIWPADRTWCVTKDVDPHWAGIGASAAAIDDLLDATGLDIVRANPTERQPTYE